MTDTREPGQSQAITELDDLLEPFRQGAARGRGHQLLGTESEKFGVLVETGKPVSYDGRTCGIVGVFDRLCESGPWNRVLDGAGGAVIALERATAHGLLAISLEPGAQLELSGAALPTVHDVAAEVDEHLEAIRPVSEACGVRWLAAGYHPTATPAELSWVPKKRYAIMREYFPSVGNRGLDMMRRTCTVQVNLDYESEHDCMQKLAVGLKLSPIATAIFANSPFSEGRIHGKKSERAVVWLDTDADRTGLLPSILSGNATWRTYVEWALGVPMYFFKRGEALVANTGQTFESFWRDGYQGNRATLADWELHLNTLFPEVRLQKTLEMRSADMQARRFFCALPAFWAGILYDATALGAASDLVAPLSHGELERCRGDVARRGLGADLAGQPMARWAEQAMTIALEGLARRDRRDALGKDERVHLAALAELTASARSPADLLVDGLDPDAPDLRARILERTDARVR